MDACSDLRGVIYGAGTLRTFPNVICLPHVAGTFTNGKRAIGVHVCEEVERLIRGERMKCEVDLTKLNILA